jgi:hypothetical protein
MKKTIQQLQADAVSAYRRTIVEECCAGAVVVELHTHITGSPRYAPKEVIPIANGPPDPELLAEVARGLLERHCLDDTCHYHVELDGDACPYRDETCQSPPFAAAWHEGAEGRVYVLVSGECEACEDGTMLEHGRYTSTALPCDVCLGAHTDVGEIARRYGGDGDAREARFVVKP